MLNLINKGESKTIEFKETLPGTSSLSKTIIAFSNTAGGKIIIGVEDKTCKIKGISEKDVIEFPDRICNIIHDSCYPAIIPEIYSEHIKSKNILVVEIYPGALKPYYLRVKGRENGTYIRVGAVNKPADIEMIQELERQRQNISFDEQINYNKTEKDIDFKKLKTDFLKLSGKELYFEDLLNLKLVKKEKDYHPTTGGLMLMGMENNFEYARIKCARFKGIEMDEFIDQKEFSGPLYEQVENAMKFAMQYIAKSGKVVGLQRIDRYEVPLEAIREALVNAVVHRDYSISGSDIKFAIFDDRIEIISPGALPRSLELEDILAGRSEIRNHVIARFFKEINFIEQWGTGIKKMIRLCREAGLKKPKMRESGLFFQVVFYKKADQKNLKAEKLHKKTVGFQLPNLSGFLAKWLKV
ncbi:ATP-dependent DNA helicase [Candidatus Magnetomoraceae bacterium gMMP-13]